MLMLISTGCASIDGALERWRGEPVALGEGEVRLYRQEATLALEGVGSVHFPAETFAGPVHVELEEASLRSVEPVVPDNMTLVGPIVNLDNREGMKANQTFEIRLFTNRTDVQVYGVFDGAAYPLDHTLGEDGQILIAGTEMGYYGLFAEIEIPTTTVAVTEATSEPTSETVTTAEVTETTTVPETTEALTASEISEEEGQASEENPLQEEDEEAAEEIPEVQFEELPEIVMLQGDDSHVYLYNCLEMKAEPFNELVVPIHPDSINPSEPYGVYNSNGEVGLIHLLTNERQMIMGPEELELYEAAWSPDGRYLVMTVRHDFDDKTIVYVYDRVDSRIRALSQGNGNGFCWNNDSRTFVYSVSNYRAESESYQLAVSKGTVNGDVSLVYAITVNEGEVQVMNKDTSGTEGQAYAIARVEDVAFGEFTVGVVYDFDTGAYRTYTSFSELYEAYMDNYHLDDELRVIYSQLGSWNLPEVVMNEDGSKVFLYDGGTYFYYPFGQVAGEEEVGSFHSLTAVNWIVADAVEESQDEPESDE